MKKALSFLLITILLICNTVLVSCGDKGNESKGKGDGDTTESPSKDNQGEQEDFKYTRDGDYIFFGEFPQTIKADDVTIIDTADSRGYYLGSDGGYYAKVTAAPYETTYTFSTGASVTSDEVYYFKVEPIRWRILSEENGEALILCDSIIANMAYQPEDIYDSSTREFFTTANGAPEGTYADNYKYSEVRKWLNDVFYKKAFTSLQQEIILTTEVNNSAESIYDYRYSEVMNGTYTCENTNDKVFLLSQAEATNAEYGFEASMTFDTERRMLTSDYSRATGVGMNTSFSHYGIGNGGWLLRSPCYDSDHYVCVVNYNGSAYGMVDIGITRIGVVPALKITL